jgi:hypothetical protein
MKYFEAAKKAAAELRPILEQAIDEAKATMNKLEHDTSLQTQKEYLTKMLSDYAPEKEGAGEFLAGYVGRFVNMNYRADGRHILTAFPSVVATNELKRSDHRKRAADALLCAQRGLIPPGLAEYPKEWESSLSASQLMTWVASVMPEEATAYTAKIEKMVAKKQEAAEQLKRLMSVDLKAIS